MIRIRIQRKGFKPAQARVNHMAAAIENGEFLDGIDQILGQSIRKTYAVQGRPTWAPRKDDKKHPILYLSGDKHDTELASIQLPWKRSKVSQSRRFRREILTTSYGVLHQYATPHYKVPFVARPVLLQLSERKQIITKIKQKVMRRR